MNKKFWLLISILLVVSLFLAACGQATTAAPVATQKPTATATSKPAEAPTLHIAMLYTGQVTVGAWNIAIHEGAVAAGKDPRFQIVEAENVDYANAADLVRQYGDENYDLVLGTSAGYEAALREVAPEYPKTFFVNYSDISSTDNLPNLAGYKFAYQDTGYLMGLTAALLTKANKIGIVGSIPVPALNNMVNGAREATRSINPAIVTELGWTQDFNDLAKGSEIAQAQIADGADVIVNFGGPGGDGAIQVACDKGVYVTGYAVDQNALCPDHLVVSWVIDHQKLISDLINTFASSGIEPGIHYYNVANGGMGISPLYNVPDDVKTKVDDAYTKMQSGEITIKDQPEAPTP